MWWISPLFMIIAGMFNAIMDVLKVKWKTSIFTTWKNQQWINPILSWTNKWKPKSELGDRIMSTVLVWITDMWHFTKMMMLMCISLAIVFYVPMFSFWLDAIIFYCLFTITFEIFFSRILIKNKL